MCRNIIIFCIVLLCHSSIFAQIEATTSDGKKVVLKNDGTWVLAVDSIPLFSDSLTCQNLIVSKYDKMTTRTTRKLGEPLRITKDTQKGFRIELLRFQNGKEVSFYITVLGAGSCIDKGAMMYVLFRDADRWEVKNQSKYNCDALYTVYLGQEFGTGEFLRVMATKEVETIRIHTTSGAVQEDLSPEQSKRLMKAIECLARYE